MLFKNHERTTCPAVKQLRLLRSFVLLSFFSLSFIGRVDYLPAPAVVTELRLNEGTGTSTADASGNAHNGTLTNGPTWGAGKYGQGVNLDGSNDYINLADHADYTLTPTVSYTWSAWVRNNNFNQWSTVWSQTLSTSSFFYFYAHSSGDAEAGPVTNGLSVYWYSGSSKLVLHSNNNVLTTGTWSYVTVNYDASLAQASRFTIYVNGTDVTNRSDVVSSGTLAAIDPTNIRIGSNQPYGEYLNGSVDEVRYYRRLLSVSEIQTDMNVGNSPLPDTQAPTVNITAPSAGNVSGTINVNANAADDVGVTGVQFLLDGNNLGAEDVTNPYSVSWNTTTATAGNHTLTARARDAAGNTTTSAAVIVNVNNDVTAPAVNITAPAAGTVSGTINVTANATDNVGVAGVQFLLDGNNLGTEDVTNPYSVSWNTTTATAGNHTLTARARDAAGNTTTSASVIVNVNNSDVTAPTVNITAPAAGNVSGTINVTANASDNVGVTGVQFLVDGNDLGTEDLTNPYSVSWNTTTISNGNHTLTARARDAAGNTTTSSAVIVNVNNDVTAPTVDITSPASGNVAGTINVTANASDNVGVAGVQFLLDGNNLGTEDVTAPYSISWNTTTASNGSHNISARARDAAGNTTMSVLVVVNVNNDAIAPTVSVNAPASSPVSGTINVTGNASDNVGVVGVQFLLDGNDLGAEDVSAPYSVSWNTTTATNGNHNITARARDAAGNTTTSATVVFNVGNGGAPAGLVAAYGFNENTGTTTNDNSGNGNTGTLTNGPVWSASGKYGAAILFDGVNDFVNINDANSLDLTNGMTIEAWINPTNMTDYKSIICKENGTTLAYALSPNDNASGTTNQRPNTRIRIGTNTTTVTGPTKLANNIWTHIAGTYDGSVLRLFINGTQVASTNVTGNITTTTNPLRIGGSTALVQYFIGLIDEVRIYNRALSQAEIQADMNTPVAADNTNPTVNITAPAAGTVSGTINVTANATDNVGVTGVQFLLDGNNLGTEDLTDPYSVSWNTSSVTNGSHTLTARARDAAGNITTSADVIVNVTNDVISPTVTITAPPAGTIEGNVDITANANDNVGVVGVQFLLNGNNLGAEDLTAPYSFTWNTTTVANGNYTLTAKARDAAGNVTTSASVVVTVNNPTDPQSPAVNITAPSGGNVSGTINVTANASDNVGVAGVQFLLDGNNLGTEDVTAPYSISWNTTTVINGNHVLSARARDAAGNTALASNVNVTVANTTPIISAISVTLITESSAVINWTTNIPATSQVNYGTAVSYGLFTLVDSALVTSHSQILNSLAPGTLYHYQVLSGNSGGSPSASGDNTFTTASLAATLGTLNTHTVFAYPAGKIVPWTPNPTNGYDTVMDLAWNYLMNIVPNDPSTGKPAYYSRSYINPNTQQMVDWPHNPAGLYGMLIESGIKYYGYSGNANVMQLANDVAIWHLDHGMTTASDNWPSVPYSEGPSGSTTYGGAPQDGVGVLEPDKIGELGYGWLQLYKYNGNIRFRDAAIQAANVLSSKIRVGNTTQSPWPFRVNAHTGSVVENYCSNMAGPISLFDGLIAAGLGDTALYRTTRNAAWTWMMNFPMQNNAWAQYFEDVGIQGSYNSNLNQYNALMVARYLLEHPEYDANWETHVRGLITWVEGIFLQAQLGANTIREQQVFNLAMGSHTSRYASVNALLYEKTGDTTARNKAYRAFNWATYMCRNNGITIDGPDINNQWFTDGYGDYIRHFMTGLGAVREWSPANQTHLVRSSSVIKSITYGSNTVSYTTFDATSTEVLHISFNPVTITANGVVLPHRSDLNQPGWTLDVATKTLKIYHTGATQIVINPGQGNRSIVQQLPTVDSVAVTPAENNNDKNSTLVKKAAEEIKAKGLIILPNPTTGNFALNYDALNKGDVVIRVTGIDGKLVSITNKAVAKGQNIIYMQSGSSWKAGVYIITVQQGNIIQQGKLVFQ